MCIPTSLSLSLSPSHGDPAALGREASSGGMNGQAWIKTEAGLHH